MINKFCLLVIGFLLIIHVPVVVVYLSGNRRVLIIIIMNNATTLSLSHQFHSHFIVFFSSNDLRRSCFLKMSRNTVQLYTSFQGSITSSYNSISLSYPHKTIYKINKRRSSISWCVTVCSHYVFSRLHVAEVNFLFCYDKSLSSV